MADKLAALLSSLTATVSRPDNTLAQALLKSKPRDPGLVLNPTQALVSCTWRDGEVCRLSTSSERRGRLETGCSCRKGRKGSQCGHQVAIVALVRQRLGVADDPIVKRFRTVLEPPPDQLFARLDRALTPAVPAASNDATRPVWLLHTSRGLELEVCTRELTKSGKLGRPRIVGAARLVDVLARSVHPQDRMLQRRFGKQLQSLVGSRYLEDVLSVLRVLADHPEVHVRDWPNAHSVVRTSPRLRVREEGDELVLDMVVAGQRMQDVQRLVDTDRLLMDPRGRRLLLVDQEDDLVDLVRELRDEVRLPRAFGPRLAERLWKIGDRLPMHLPESLRPKQQTADARVRLALSGEAGEWKVRLLVRPLGEKGPSFAPGEGEATPGVASDRGWLMTQRDLDGERVRAGSLALRLDLPVAPPDWNATLPLDALLALAEKVQGIDDVIVEWPRRVPTLVAPRARLKVQVTAANDWFSVDGTAEIGGVDVALGRLLAARRAQQRFLEVAPNQFVDVARVFDDRLRRLVDTTRETGGKLVLPKVAAPHAPELFEGVDELRAPTDWQQFAQRARTLMTFEPRLPDALQATLRDYQVDGYRWMRRLAELGLGAVLADDMGLGKTLQAIAMLVERAPGGPQLVVAPTSVAFNWARELARFAPSLRVHHLRDAADRRRLALEAGPGDVLIASWALLRSELDALHVREWRTLVLDEAQAVKNWDTDTARAARKLHAGWRLALTGTPVENHLGELFSLLETVLPGLFGSWDAFMRRWAAPIERAGDKEVQAALARLVRPFILRRTKKQVARELPERTEQRLDVELSELERRLYEAARITAIEGLTALDDGAPTGRIRVLAELTRLRQLASSAHLADPAAPRESSKTKLLLEQLEEVLSEGRAALVFSQFVRQLDLVGEALTQRGVPFLRLTGDTPAKERERLVDAFQRGDAQVFLVSLHAGGTGLNLTAADTVFLLDPWWNPAVEDQAADRAHRIGQKRPVTIVRLVSRGTIEERVLDLHERKRDLVRGVLGEADVAGRLSTAELIELMRQPS